MIFRLWCNRVRTKSFSYETNTNRPWIPRCLTLSFYIFRSMWRTDAYRAVRTIIRLNLLRTERHLRDRSVKTVSKSKSIALSGETIWFIYSIGDHAVQINEKGRLQHVLWKRYWINDIHRRKGFVIKIHISLSSPNRTVSARTSSLIFLLTPSQLEWHNAFVLFLEEMMTRTKSEGKKSGKDNQMEGHLSNERTILSWIRTGLSIFTIGCAIARFGGTNNSQVSLRSPGSQKKPIISGLILAICGVICLFYSLWRFIRVHLKIKYQQDSSEPDIFGPIISIFLLTGALIAVVIIFSII